MRIYIYKVIIFIVAIFFLYQFTVGYTIHSFQKKIFSKLDKETSEKLKDKIRQELNSSLKKDNILEKEDAILLKKFLDKISSELIESK